MKTERRFDEQGATPAEGPYVVGKRVERLDSLSKVLGRPIYAADMIPNNSLHMKVVRSSYPHAIIKNISVSKAKRRSGVRAVITAPDIPGTNVSSCIIPDRPLLAYHKVRSVGDIVAAVVADTPDIAKAAAKLVTVEYDPLPVITSPVKSMEPNSVKVHDRGNIVRHLKLRKGDINEGFLKSDVVVEETYSTQFQDAVPIEPEAGFAIYEKNGSITAVACMQNPHYVRGAVARIVDKPEDKVRIIQAATGGTFGTKSDEVVIDICGLTAIATLKTRKPVALMYTREESMIMHSKRHPFVIRHKAGATKDGTLTAVQVELIADTGAYVSNGTLVITRALFHVTGPYVVPNVKADAYCVYTNNTLAGSFRGFGNPQAHFAAESQMDKLAERLGLDPLEFRLKNILRPGTATATGQVLDQSVGLEECVAKVRKASDWDRKQKEYNSVSGRFRKGIGLALLYHGNSVGPEGMDRSSAVVSVKNDGRVTFKIGLTEYGTGARTGLAQLIAETLGVPFEWVADEAADTSTTPDSGGTFASRTTVMGGRAVAQAAHTIRQRLNAVAAELLDCEPGEVQIRNGTVNSAVNSLPRINFEKLVAECQKRGVRLSDKAEFIATGVTFNEENCQGIPYLQYTFGAVVAEVEVDTLLGIVNALKITTAYDVGKAINPLSLEGQIDGGATQALGYALMEELIHKEGLVVNPSLAEYYMPTAVDCPAIESYLVEYPGKLGPYGAKAMGEPPIVAPAPALLNAIYHATRLRINELPASPEKLLLKLKRNSP